MTSHDENLHLYATMCRIRASEEKIADWIEENQRDGITRTPCHLSIGQEAVAAGVCAALDVKDTVWGGHRSHGHYLAKGGDLGTMFAEILGSSMGCANGRGGSMHLGDPHVGVAGTVPIVAATIPMAVGAGLAYSLKGEQRVAVAFFGDGATEEGSFFESANLAAMHRLPVLFVVENNFYASHMHLSERRLLDNLYQYGEILGMAAERIDGNDVLTVRDAAAKAVKRAKSGLGPTLLECRTFRWRGHVGSAWDEDVGVKRSGELADWLPRCPLKRQRQRLLLERAMETGLAELESAVADEVTAAWNWALCQPQPNPETLMEGVFMTTTGEVQSCVN